MQLQPQVTKQLVESISQLGWMGIRGHEGLQGKSKDVSMGN